MRGSIDRDNDTIRVVGALVDFRRFLSSIYHAIERTGCQSITVDLSDCTSAFPNSMLSVCAQVMGYRNAGTDFSLKLPKKQKLSNLFLNANWAHLLDPHQFDPSSFRGYTRIPATQYKTSEQQQNAVNKIVDVILGAIPDMQRADFAAFEWSINELTDNVLVHSKSSIGGLIQVSTFQKINKKVQFVVADSGIGIPDSIREGHPEKSDMEAINMAIQEGVTRDKRVGQGNGLFGSYQICSRSNGDFSVDSGYARLEYTEKKILSVSDHKIPYSGTLVVATVDFSEPNLLEQALSFRGKKYTPVDYVETNYERSDDNVIIFKLKEQATSFGSRVSGKPIRTRLSNLLGMAQDCKVHIDFEGVPIISSSFADEAFAKLFLEAGAVEFMQRFEFVNSMETIKQLINKAINQRVSSGVVD